MNFPVLNGQLPNGFCPSDLQTMLNGFSQQQYVNISVTSSIVVSSTTPSAADHDKAWLQLDSFGRPVRLYFFAQGAWLSQHPLPPGFIMIWNQALPNFQTFDGGDANAAPWASLSGQMWQLAATTLDGLGTPILNSGIPLGVSTGTGSLPSGALVTLGQTGGEDLHKITGQEMFPHTHGVHVLRVQHGSVDTDVMTPNTGDPSQQPDKTTLSFGGDPATGSPPTAALGHNTLPPFTGVYFLQRTNRLFYLVPP